MSGASEVPAIPEDVRGLAHELWAMAQCGPHEGIEDAVERMAALLTARPVDTGREKALEEAELLKWFGEKSAHELSYGPVDERDEMGEHGWRVIEKRGSINDWEWHILATGNSPRHALARALASQKKGDGRG